jgi:hypothetical protein
VRESRLGWQRSFTDRIASRSDPGPESLALVTIVWSTSGVAATFGEYSELR